MNTTYLKGLMLLLPATAIMLSSCQQDPEPAQPTITSLSFSSSIAGLSRATDTGFENGDAISVFAIDPTESATGQLGATSYATNVRYVYSQSLFEADGTPIYYDHEGHSLFFKAVYPYIPSFKGPNITFSVSSDQSDYDNYTHSDLMLAETMATSEAVPNLSFYHYLSNVIINITFQGERPAGGHTVELLDMPTIVDFDINSKAVKTYTSPVSIRTIKSCANGTDSYKAIVAPHTTDASASVVKLTMGDKVMYWQPGKALDWRSGKQYTYDLVVTRSGEIKFTADINPWDEDPAIEDIVPPALLDEMEEWIPIHRGVNPPNVEGAYFIDPMTTVYCQDEGNGGYEPGRVVNSEYIHFLNQDNSTLTLDYESVAQNGTASEVGYGSFISGSGDDFTVYFDTEGQSNGIYTRTALVISGTMTPDGVSDLRYAFVMVEKGDDPDRKLMDEGVFRIFCDGDDIALRVNWPGMNLSRSAGLDDLPSAFARK